MGRQTSKMEIKQGDGNHLTIYGSIVRDTLHKSQRRKGFDKEVPKGEQYCSSVPETEQSSSPVSLQTNEQKV